MIFKAIMFSILMILSLQNSHLRKLDYLLYYRITTLFRTEALEMQIVNELQFCVGKITKIF